MRMEMNLEEIKKANEDHICKMRNRLDRHFRLLQDGRRRRSGELRLV
jgi:hypothetical protein